MQRTRKNLKEFALEGLMCTCLMARQVEQAALLLAVLAVLDAIATRLNQLLGNDRGKKPPRKIDGVVQLGVCCVDGGEVDETRRPGTSRSHSESTVDVYECVPVPLKVTEALGNARRGHGSRTQQTRVFGRLNYRLNQDVWQKACIAIFGLPAKLASTCAFWYYAWLIDTKRTSPGDAST
jgi:hypothetical protein